jgi:hypothetical protein
VVVVGNRDWNRVKAELEAGVLGNREHGRRRPVNRRDEELKPLKSDTDSILKHIEEALQKDEDGI